MRIQQLACLSLLHFCLILHCINIVSISSQCLNSQKLILIELKNTVKFISSWNQSSTILSWNQSTDCCSWKGVDCSTDGHVVGLDLSYDWISGGPISHFIESLTQLVYLDLSLNKFTGPILHSIESLTNLVYLDLSSNQFTGPIPHSIESLTQLVILDLSSNKFTGPIPHSIESLTQLVHLDLSSNEFTGPIPSFQKSKNLTHLGLFQNGLSGPIPDTYFEGLVNLADIDLKFNAFNGSIPSSLFALPALQFSYLSNNNFHGLLANFSNASSSLLIRLDFSSNKLKGSIPKSFFDLKRLEILDLSNNHLNGTVELEAFGVLQKLISLDLSYNNLSITQGDNSSFLFPKLETLNLASCNLKHFPYWHMHRTFRLERLDLSDNKIGGEIPSWIWNVLYLNLSHNELQSFQEPYVVLFDLYVLDLHANQLHGNFPIPGHYTLYVDYSFNHFNSSLPDLVCNASSELLFLDLSSNCLSGTIPSCLIDLSIFRLGNNNLSGNIPEIFPTNCRLESLDLHGNHLQGKVPKSLGNCPKLEVLNLGNNLLSDTFPCFLMKKCTDLRVLSLRSNKLHGDFQCRGAITVWSKLQIINIASNYFVGYVPRSFFQNWTAMIANEDGGQSKSNYLHVVVVLYSTNYFDKVTVVIKGSVIELEKILTIFTSIDLSDNSFSGEIPSRIGELKQLYSLNMSHNAFTGSIPASFGNLKELGALDLSVNHLAGRIPIELAGLTYLGFLNLSCNVLEGMIPAGQLQTFTEASFEGNKGLCGIQLNTSCVGEQGQGLSPPPLEKTETGGFLISFEVGIIVGLVTVIAPLVLSRRWNKWYFEQIDRFVVAKVYQYYQRRNQERKNPIRRL